jgi:uncharacterized membrane protein YjgN (DUF898 family)
VDVQSFAYNIDVGQILIGKLIFIASVWYSKKAAKEVGFQIREKGINLGLIAIQHKLNKIDLEGGIFRIVVR